MIYSFQRLRKIVQERAFPTSTLDDNEDQAHASEKIPAITQAHKLRYFTILMFKCSASIIENNQKYLVPEIVQRMMLQLCFQHLEELCVVFKRSSSNKIFQSAYKHQNNNMFITQPTTGSNCSYYMNTGTYGRTAILLNKILYSRKDSQYAGPSEQLQKIVDDRHCSMERKQ